MALAGHASGVVTPLSEAQPRSSNERVILSGLLYHAKPGFLGDDPGGKKVTRSHRKGKYFDTPSTWKTSCVNRTFGEAQNKALALSWCRKGINK